MVKMLHIITWHNTEEGTHGSACCIRKVSSSGRTKFQVLLRPDGQQLECEAPSSLHPRRTAQGRQGAHSWRHHRRSEPEKKPNKNKIQQMCFQGVFGNMYGESQAAKLALKQVAKFVFFDLNKLHNFSSISLLVAGDRARVGEGLPRGGGRDQRQRLYQPRHPGPF